MGVTNGPLAGQVGIVTGGGRGIGAAVAHHAAAAGASMVVSDLGGGTDGTGRDTGAAQACADEIVAAGGRAVADDGDVTSFEDASRTVERAVEEFGRVDFVVHSAGILRDGIFHKMSPEDFRAVLDVHLFGAFNIARAAAERFRAQSSGAFVFMTSTSGLIGAVGQANYSAAKAGMVSLSRSIATDMSRFGVRSNAIAPFAYTRLTAQLDDVEGESSDRVRRMQAMTADTVAPVATFLASPLAEDVTGQVFVVRQNEVFLMSQPRPLRSVHRSDGWDLESLRDTFVPSIRSYLYSLETSAEHFAWDPI